MKDQNKGDRFKNLWFAYTSGGQTAAREPHAVLRNSACGSQSFPKIYVFVFYLLFLL